MSYIRTNWHNDSDPPINAANLNNIEDGIAKNETDILGLQGRMRFIGETSILPESPNVGDVYQATNNGLVSQNKAGDLLVFTSNNSWHVIPSGDEHDGTVTYIEAGPGISINGGSITRSGTISIDTTYTANGSHNGLMTSEQFNTINNLKNIALSSSYSDLINIPDAAKRPIYNDLTENSQEAVVSQSGLKTLFDGKADSQHNHLIEEIKDSLGDTGEEHDLYYYLASISDGVGDTIPVKAAPQNHLHGNITSSGYLLTDQGTSANNRWLRTDGNGSITSQETIPSSVIRGYTLRNNEGNSPIDLSQVNTLTTDLSNRLQSIETIVGDTSSQNGVVKEIQDIKTDLIALNDEISRIRSLLGGGLPNNKNVCGMLTSASETITNTLVPKTTFTWKTFSLSDVRIPKNSTASSDDGQMVGSAINKNHIPINIAYSGYHPIALVGFDLDNNVSGGGAHMCVPMCFFVQDGQVVWQIRNNYSNTAKINIQVKVLFYKVR